MKRSLVAALLISLSLVFLGIFGLSVREYTKSQFIKETLWDLKYSLRGDTVDVDYLVKQISDLGLDTSDVRSTPTGELDDVLDEKLLEVHVGVGWVWGGISLLLMLSALVLVLTDVLYFVKVKNTLEAYLERLNLGVDEELDLGGDFGFLSVGLNRLVLNLRKIKEDVKKITGA